MDIRTEEFAHLEIMAAMVYKLTKDASVEQMQQKGENIWTLKTLLTPESARSYTEVLRVTNLVVRQIGTGGQTLLGLQDLGTRTNAVLHIYLLMVILIHKFGIILNQTKGARHMWWEAIGQWFTLPGRICVKIIGYKSPIFDSKEVKEFYVKSFTITIWFIMFFIIAMAHVQTVQIFVSNSVNSISQLNTHTSTSLLQSNRIAAFIILTIFLLLVIPLGAGICDIDECHRKTT